MVAELQYEQTYVMNILDSYRIIHEKLFRKVLNEGTFHRRNCQLEMMFKDKHDKQGRTAKDHEMLFKTIVNYYPVSSEKLLKKELVHSIP